jgi:hypothetical protein
MPAPRGTINPGSVPRLELLLLNSGQLNTTSRLYSPFLVIFADQLPPKKSRKNFAVNSAITLKYIEGIQEIIF